MNEEVGCVLSMEDNCEDSIAGLTLDEVVTIDALLLGNEDVWLLLLVEDNNVDSCLLFLLDINDEFLLLVADTVAVEVMICIVVVGIKVEIEVEFKFELKYGIVERVVPKIMLKV